MSRTRTSLAKRLFAATGAAAIGMVGLAGTALAATPEEGTPPGQTREDDTGSLTIYKLVGAEGARGDGTEHTFEEGTVEPLKDVTFTLWQVGKKDGDNCKPLNLRQPADWDLVPTTDNDAPGVDANAGLCKVEPGDARYTDVDGKITYEELPLGLYYVEETHAPQNVVRQTAPFYVTIPYPSNNITTNWDDETGNWIYDVVVYPKNRLVDSPKKNVTERPDHLFVGSTVTWTISVKVPELQPGDDDFDSASVWDVLDTNLSYKDSTVKLCTEISTPDTGPWECSGTEEVIFPSDATGNPFITVDSSDQHDTNSPQTGKGVTWTFTGSGLGLLKDYQGGGIVVTLNTQVDSIPADGIIINAPDGKSYGAEFDGASKPGCCSPETVWGQLDILKTDAHATSPKLLAGAEFSVTERPVTRKDTEANPIVYQYDDCPTSPDSTALVATGVSGTDGKVTWTAASTGATTGGLGETLGLWIANHQTNTGQTGIQNGPWEKDYCVYETKAPAGYTLGEFDTAQTIKAGTDAKLVLPVKNPQKEGPNLPLTGANGTMLMMVGGLALMGIAGGTYMVTRRKAANTK